MPLVGRRVRHRTKDADAGIVDEHIEPPELPDRGVDGYFDLVLPADVGANTQHLQARDLPELGGGDLERRVRGGHDRHARASIEKRACDREADSAGTTGHDRDFPCQGRHQLLQYTGRRHPRGSSASAPPGNMTTVAIIGAGELGGATAQALAARESADRLVLIDAAADIAAGKALDIRQAGAIDRYHTHLEGTSDLSGAIGCSVCVIADRAGQSPSEWQGEEGLSMLARLARYLADAPVVFAGSTQADLIALGAREVPLRWERLIGSLPEALASSLAAVVAVEARCSSTDVNLAVLGAPPAGFVVLWSEATIGGYALERVLAPVQLARIEARATYLWPARAVRPRRRRRARRRRHSSRVAPLVHRAYAAWRRIRRAPSRRRAARRPSSARHRSHSRARAECARSRATRNRAGRVKWDRKMLLLLARLALLASLAGAVTAAPPSIEPEAILRHIQFLAADVEAAARATGDIEIRRGGPGAGRSDDSSFVVRRVPALHFFTGFHADYHDPGDDWNRVNGAGRRTHRDAGPGSGRAHRRADRPAGVRPQEVSAVGSHAPTLPTPPLCPAIPSRPVSSGAASALWRRHAGRSRSSDRPRCSLDLSV